MATVMSVAGRTHFNIEAFGYSGWVAVSTYFTKLQQANIHPVLRLAVPSDRFNTSILLLLCFHWANRPLSENHLEAECFQSAPALKADEICSLTERPFHCFAVSLRLHAFPQDLGDIYERSIIRWACTRWKPLHLSGCVCRWTGRDLSFCASQ